MERLLITKNGIAYSATAAAGTANSLTTRDQLDTLKEGSIVAFEKNGTRVTAAGSFTKTDTHGVFALGMPDGVNTRVSPLINWETLKYNKNTYVAPVAEVLVIGGDGVADRTSGAFASGDIGTEFVCTVASTSGDFRQGTTALLKVVSTGVSLAADTDLVAGVKYEVIAAGTPDAWGGATLSTSTPGSLVIGTKVVGGEYGITIQDLEKETWERNKESISLTLTSASMTDAQMLTALVNAFNANPKTSAIATASVLDTDAGIKLVGVNAGERFTAFPTGLLYGTTVYHDGSGITNPGVTGEGTNLQILDLEAKTSGIEGATGTFVNDQIGQKNPIYKVPSLVEPGINYTVFVLEWTDQRAVAYPSNNANPMHKRLNIAVPSADSTMITAVTNLLDDLVG